MEAMLALKRFTFNVVAPVVLIVMAAALGFGVPLFWLWVASLIQGDTLAPSFAAYLTVPVGMVVSYAVAVFLWVRLRWVLGLYDESAGAPRHEWNRAMTDERRQHARGDALEQVLIVTVMIVTVICTVWFFLFGDPGVRPS